MQIEIKTHNAEVTPELRLKMERHFERVARQVPPLAVLHLRLNKESNPAIHDSQVAEATLHLKHADLHTHEASDDMATSLERVAKKLARQVKRYSEKRHVHHVHGPRTAG